MFIYGSSPLVDRYLEECNKSIDKEKAVEMTVSMRPLVLGNSEPDPSSSVSPRIPHVILHGAERKLASRASTFSKAPWNHPELSLELRVSPAQKSIAFHEPIESKPTCRLYSFTWVLPEALAGDLEPKDLAWLSIISSKLTGREKDDVLNEFSITVTL